MVQLPLVPRCDDNYVCLVESGLERGGQGGTKYRGPSCFEGPSRINARNTLLRCNVQYFPAGWKQKI